MKSLFVEYYKTAAREILNSDEDLDIAVAFWGEGAQTIKSINQAH
jgi:hypothetical protein